MTWHMTTLHDSAEGLTRVRAFRLSNTADRRLWVSVTESCGSVAIMGPGAPRGGVTTQGIALDRLVHRQPNDARLVLEFFRGLSTTAERGKLFDVWSGFCRCWWADGGPGGEG